VGSSHHPKLADRLRRASSVRRFQCYERSLLLRTLHFLKEAETGEAFTGMSFETSSCRELLKWETGIAGKVSRLPKAVRTEDSQAWDREAPTSFIASISAASHRVLASADCCWVLPMCSVREPG
jgi:hypothetical protein